MPFVPVPNTAQVDVIWEHVGGRVEHVLYFEDSQPFTEVALETLANEVANAYATRLGPWISTAYQFREVIATALDSDSAPRFVRPVLSVFGTRTGAVLPSNVAFAIKHLTTARGRSFRGRSFMFGLVEPDVGGDTMSNIVADGITLAWQLFQADIEAGALGVVQVIVSRIADGVLRAVGVTTPITGHNYTDLIVDSMRRRLTGRGA